MRPETSPSQHSEFLTLLFFPLEARRRRRAAAKLTLDELKKGDSVDVNIEPMCIFLFRDGNFSLPHQHCFLPLTRRCFLGTVISFNSKPDLDLTGSIATRIRQQDSTLRTTADPSLLVESLLDLGTSLTLEPLNVSNMILTSCRRCYGNRGRVPCAA